MAAPPPAAKLPTIRPHHSPRLRVGFITSCLVVGGVEHWLLALAKYSNQELDWSVVVTNPTLVDTEMRSAIEQYAEVGIGESVLPQLVNSVDVIVAWGVDDLERLVRGFDGPIVQVAHNVGCWTENFLAANRSVASNSVAVSQAAATAFRHRDVTVIPNGVDRDRCHALRSREVVRQEWGLAPNEVAIGFVGRLSPEKNPLAISRAVRELGPGFRAVYVGKGYFEDLRPAARAITPDAIFVPPMHQIGDALNALDCLIMASSCEGFSLALVECLVAGLPLVTTPVGIVPDLLREHGLSLVTVPIAPSSRQLAEAVQKAISPAHRPFIEQARTVAIACYTAEVMAGNWVAYLQGLRCR